MNKRIFRGLAQWALLCLVPLAFTQLSMAASASMAGQSLKIFTWVYNYADSNSAKAHLCSAPGTSLSVRGDDGNGTLSITVEKTPKSALAPPGTLCSDGLVQIGVVYTIASKNIVNTNYISQSLVTGVLAVPFKFHISSRATTAGSTIGGYAGYRFGVANAFTFTPIVSGGLALVSTQAAQTGSTTPSTSNTQTSSGFSVAIGAIGSVSNTGAGTQFGLLVGVDWLGKSSNYQYNGKPWLAFEIGYNFSQ